MILLDDTSPVALAVDTTLPPSSATLHAVLALEWPRLGGRVQFVQSDFGQVALAPTDVVVSSHACGRLTDSILQLAADARARVAVLPCCHDKAACDAGQLGGWLDASLAIDVMRATRLEQQGYRIRTHTIPSNITSKNRLLIGEPAQ